MHHDCYQSSLCILTSTNVGHEPSQACSTLDGLGSCDLKVFTEAKPSIPLQPLILDACFPLKLIYSENDLRVLKGSPVCDQQILDLFRGTTCYLFFGRPLDALIYRGSTFQPFTAHADTQLTVTSTKVIQINFLWRS